MVEDLSVTMERVGTVVSVAVVGELDLSSERRLAAAFAEAMGQPGVTAVLVDLSGLSFLDSSGIAVLLKGRRSADALGIEYRISGARDMVRQVLDMTGIWAHLTGPPGSTG